MPLREASPPGAVDGASETGGWTAVTKRRPPSSAEEALSRIPALTKLAAAAAIADGPIIAEAARQRRISGIALRRYARDLCGDPAAIIQANVEAEALQRDCTDLERINSDLAARCGELEQRIRDLKNTADPTDREQMLEQRIAELDQQVRSAHGDADLTREGADRLAAMITAAGYDLAASIDAGELLPAGGMPDAGQPPSQTETQPLPAAA